MGKERRFAGYVAALPQALGLAQIPLDRAVLAARLGSCVADLRVPPPEIRRVAYTADAIKTLDMRVRKFIKARRHFPTDKAAIKLLWLALRNVLAKSARSEFDGKREMNQFAILFGECFTLARN